MQEDAFSMSSVENRGPVSVVTILKKRLLTPQDGNAINKIIDDLIKKDQKRIVLSFKDVDLMTSSILGALVSILKKT